VQREVLIERRQKSKIKIIVEALKEVGEGIEIAWNALTS